MSDLGEKEDSNSFLSESDSKKDLIVKYYGGITSDRITNLDKLEVIDELIKCPICFNYLNKPYECELCGGLFCEDCIQNWLKTKHKCPLRCPEVKIKRADINSRKLLNVVELHCINYPDCNYVDKYWDLLAHEEKCNFQKIKCPNYYCNFKANFSDLKNHLLSCEYSNIQCGFCKAIIIKAELGSHLEKHKKNNNFIIKPCSLCNSDQDIKRCLCGECICANCLEENDINLHKDCCAFMTGLNYTDKIYNVSKKPLPINFECKITFLGVHWIRVGITFEPKIGEIDEDVNCPPFDIYCILEDLKQFYTYKNKWKYIFNSKDLQLAKGDVMIMRFKNGELRYIINGEDLENIVKIPLVDKGDFYLFIQCRNDKSKAQIDYITEIFD